MEALRRVRHCTYAAYLTALLLTLTLTTGNERLYGVWHAHNQQSRDCIQHVRSYCEVRTTKDGTACTHPWSHCDVATHVAPQTDGYKSRPSRS